MFIKNIGNLIKQHIINNILSYILLFCTFVAGIAAGAFTVNGLSEVQNEELIHYFYGFIEFLKSQNVEKSIVFYQSLVTNFKIIFAIWFLGVTVIGIPLIFVLIAIKGFITGFSIGFLINCINFNGLIFSIVSILPREIIITPCLFGLAVCGINFSLMIVKSRSKKSYFRHNLKVDFIAYNFLTAIYSLLAIVGIMTETYCGTIVTKNIIPLYINIAYLNILC